MLTGKQVRVRHARTKVVPQYIDVASDSLLATAEELLVIFRDAIGKSRGELEAELDEVIGDKPDRDLEEGLAKLLEDRCEFEVQSESPPDESRAAVFRAATLARAAGPFDRNRVLADVAVQLQIPIETLERNLFADLKSEQHLIRFDDITAERLLRRYNVALAQAVLLRAIRLEVVIRDEQPQRYRQVFRAIKFCRLICSIEQIGKTSYKLSLDGPLSLFSATNKYGLQLAMFLPHLLRCGNFDLRAELRWGPERREKYFQLTSAEALESYLPDHGSYVPPELAGFAELFRKKVVGWSLSEEPDLFPLGKSVWVPDFRLTHRLSGAVVYLEVLGFWRRHSVEAHLSRLREFCKEKFILAVSDSLHVDEGLAELPGGVLRFKQIPLPDEVAKLAASLIGD